MNYKLLAGINYQVRHIDRELGEFQVHCSIENKEEFNEDLIVQKHNEVEESILFTLRMSLVTEEFFAIMFKGEEISSHKTEQKAHNEMEKLLNMSPFLKDLLELEIIYKEVYVLPPSHEIRRMLLWEMDIQLERENLDQRDGRDHQYDGPGADFGFNFDGLL